MPPKGRALGFTRDFFASPEIPIVASALAVDLNTPTMPGLWVADGEGSVTRVAPANVSPH
jgi:hypothetical protein